MKQLPYFLPFNTPKKIVTTIAMVAVAVLIYKVIKEKNYGETNEASDGDDRASGIDGSGKEPPNINISTL